MTQLMRFSVIRKRKVSFQKKNLHYRVLRQNMQRVAVLISAAKRLANTTLNHGGKTLLRWRAVDDTASNLNNM